MSKRKAALGESYIEGSDCFRTHPIDVQTKSEVHYEGVVVYGNRRLAEKITAMLNELDEVIPDSVPFEEPEEGEED